MIAPILLSLKVASIATAFTAVFGIFAAYVAVKQKIPALPIFETFFTIPMILPPSVIGYLLLLLLGKRGWIGSFLYDNFAIRLIFTWQVAVIAAVVVSFPLMYQNAKAAFLTIHPEMEEAAKVYGAGGLVYFWKIALPMAIPGIISGFILSFCRSLGEFGATLMVAGNIPGKTQTMSTAIYYAVENGDSQTAGILVAVMTAISFGLILFLNIWQRRRKWL